jgi:hypothetical protein
MCAVGVLSIFADTTTTLPVQANVPQSWELHAWVAKTVGGFNVYDQAQPGTTIDLGSSNVTTLLDFGNLAYHKDIGMAIPDSYFTVFLYADTAGMPFQIAERCDGIYSGAANLNKNLIATPSYEPADAFLGSAPQGIFFGMSKTCPFGTIGPSALLVSGKDNVICKSDVNPWIVRCYVGFSVGNRSEPPGTEMVKGDQLSGNYQGDILFTLMPGN